MRGCAARAAELHGVPDPQVSLPVLNSLRLSGALMPLDLTSGPVDWLVDGPVLFDWAATPVPPLDGWLRGEAWEVLSL